MDAATPRQYAELGALECGIPLSRGRRAVSLIVVVVGTQVVRGVTEDGCHA